MHYDVICPCNHPFISQKFFAKQLDVTCPKLATFKTSTKTAGADGQGAAVSGCKRFWSTLKIYVWHIPLKFVHIHMKTTAIFCAFEITLCCIWIQIVGQSIWVSLATKGRGIEKNIRWYPLILKRFSDWENIRWFWSEKRFSPGEPRDIFYFNCIKARCGWAWNAKGGSPILQGMYQWLS